MVRGCLASLVLALVLVAGAAADGDPASDVLLQSNTYLPSVAPSAGAQTLLDQSVASVYAKGQRVKVAVIASADDLGAVPSLFGHPMDYAKFLGTELQFLYVAPLLVVMPGGFGVYDGGRTTAAEEAVLAREHVSGPSSDQLTRSAAAAVGDLLRAGALQSKDVLPPLATPSQTSARRGRTAKLSYRLYDDSGRASAVLTISSRTGHVLARIAVPLRPTGFFQATKSAAWKVPGSLPVGQLKLCIVGTDPSGNRSRKACEAILVT